VINQSPKHSIHTFTLYSFSIMLQDERLLCAQLAIFIVLVGPAQFCLFTHGWRGFLGWLCVVSFCTIRIIGAAMSIHDESQGGPISTASMIVSSLGLSPVLLALVGILHEAYVSERKHLTLSPLLNDVQSHRAWQQSQQTRRMVNRVLDP
jgi:hypothetical protein